MWKRTGLSRTEIQMELSSFSSLLWFLSALFKKEVRVGKAETLLCHEVTVLSLCPCPLSHPRLETAEQLPEKGTVWFIMCSSPLEGQGLPTPAGQKTCKSSSRFMLKQVIFSGFLLWANLEHNRLNFCALKYQKYFLRISWFFCTVLPPVPLLSSGCPAALTWQAVQEIPPGWALLRAAPGVGLSQSFPSTATGSVPAKAAWI